MTATGNWNLTVKTPMGEQKMLAQFAADGEVLAGTMQDVNQPAAAIKDGTVKGNRLEWKFDMKRPFPMTLTFALELDGDVMTGTGKAGIFPSVPVSGTRVR